MRSKEAFAYSRSTGYFCSVVNREDHLSAPTRRLGNDGPGLATPPERSQ